MTLWILRPVEDLPHGDNPWDPWYDKAFGFVVRAESERQARMIADEQACDENRGEFMESRIAATKNPWLDPKYSTCVPLDADGEAGVVLSDIRSA